MRVYKFTILFFLIAGCHRSPSPKRLQLMSGSLLKWEEINYPSGSSLTFYNDSLYLMGDDARELYVLDTAFEVLKSIVLFPGKSIRQRKSFKADIEAGGFLQLRDKTELVLISSGSVAPYRDSVFKIDIRSTKLDKSSFRQLYNDFKRKGIAEVNIEGAAFVREDLFFANRSNLSNRQNYLIRLKSGFPLSGQKAFKIIPLNLSDSTLGVSGLDYYKKKDLLFLTLSSEATTSASADGEIGNSALAIISNMSKKMEADSLNVDGFLNFTSIDTIFRNKKIESVAVGKKEKGGLILYLSADNDDGKSILYKVKLRF